MMNTLTVKGVNGENGRDTHVLDDKCAYERGDD